MITEHPRFKREVQDAIDNKVVSWSLLKWLNSKEHQYRADLLNFILILLFGKENKFLWSAIYLVFRKEIREMLDDTKEITKEKLLELIEKLKRYKKEKNL